jgi:hypothetical protein
MSRPHVATRSLDHERGLLEEILTGWSGDEIRIRALDRRACEFAGRWPSQILDAELESGARLSVIRKQVGVSGHPDKSYPDKEIRMYARVLLGGSLPVPRYFGARWDEAAQTHELYLEYVDALSLKYQGIALWYRAAEAIGQLHAHFAHRLDDLRAEEALQTLDAAYFRRWAERARVELDAHLPDLSPELATLLSGYDDVVVLLAEAQRTLVHNDLGARNVVVDAGRAPPRVCIVDWENAGIGCGVVDLTHLTYGLAEDERRRMCQAYFAKLEGSPLAVGEVAGADRLAAAGEVHRVVYRLGRCRRRGYSREAVLGLLAHAVRFRNRI